MTAHSAACHVATLFLSLYAATTTTTTSSGFLLSAPLVILLCNNLPIITSRVFTNMLHSSTAFCCAICNDQLLHYSLPFHLMRPIFDSHYYLMFDLLYTNKIFHIYCMSRQTCSYRSTLNQFLVYLIRPRVGLFYRKFRY